jgi:hypothetical protein
MTSLPTPPAKIALVDRLPLPSARGFASLAASGPGPATSAAPVALDPDHPPGRHGIAALA